MYMAPRRSKNAELPRFPQATAASPASQDRYAAGAVGGVAVRGLGTERGQGATGSHEGARNTGGW